jgi:hypothetical protein
MKLVIAMATLLAFESASPVMAVAAPSRLAIYYGYPSLVEGAAGDVARAAGVFAGYDVIVFGDGLELGDGPGTDPGLRAERERIGPLIRALHLTSRQPRIYGYIDLGSSQKLDLAEIARRIDAWKRLGVDGIFFDEAGRDFAVTPGRRDAAVCAVHARGLSAFMNAFNPDDLFDDRAAASDEGCDAGLTARDALLIESFAVRNGELEPASRIDGRSAAALKWRSRTGIRVFGVTTTDGRAHDRRQFEWAWMHAVSHGLDGFGWGEPAFSAVDSRLPWRERP